MTIKFKVDNQIITRLDDNPLIADSANVIDFEFEFSSEWAGLTFKTAIISYGRNTYWVAFSGNKITTDRLPIFLPGEWTVGVFGGDLRTTNTTPLNFAASAVSNNMPPIPAQDIYGQMLSIAGEAHTLAQSVVDRANNGSFNGLPGEATEEYRTIGQQVANNSAAVNTAKIAAEAAKKAAEDANMDISNKLNLAQAAAGTATTKAGIATTQAGIATTKAQAAADIASSLSKTLTQVTEKAAEVGDNASNVAESTTLTLSAYEDISKKYPLILQKVEQTESNKTASANSASAASSSASSAAQSAISAKSYRDSALQSKNEAVEAKNTVLQKETEISQIKSDADQIAQSVRIDADNGVFDGADGASLQYNWNGTQLGIKRDDEENYNYTDLEGEQGINAYELWLASGHSGTIDDYFAFIKGEHGEPYNADVTALSGTNINIAENNIYTLTISAGTTINNTFTVNAAKHQQSILYIKMTASASITWTGFAFVNGTIPTLVNGNCYRIVFEYNPLKNSVIVGAIHDGAVV